MDLKEVFEKLKKLENGAEMITAIKAETNRLNEDEVDEHNEHKCYYRWLWSSVVVGGYTTRLNRFGNIA